MRVCAAKLLFLLVALVATDAFAGVGFFTPGGIPEAVIGKTQIGEFNAVSPQQVAKNLKKLAGTDFKAYIDLGPTITTPASASQLSMRYTIPSGVVREKKFEPRKVSGVFTFLPDQVLMTRLAPVLDVLSRHEKHVAGVFLADEPYLNGISKAQLEHAAKVVRRGLDERGLENVKIGVIFAAGMFNRGFAKMINRQSGRYAASLDDRFLRGERNHTKWYKKWVKWANSSRLVTYDRAGNMYLGGGLPRGFDVFGFDYYLSTILLDQTYDQSLAWFAEHYPSVHACARFATQPITKIRSKLAFFRGKSPVHGTRFIESDRAILDAMYRCRMGAVTLMLKKASGERAHASQYLMLSESSANGVRRFDKHGNLLDKQPRVLVESRTLDEVVRGEKFYSKHKDFYTAGLLFFTFNDVYASVIHLHIPGAASMPAVVSSIYCYAAKLEKTDSHPASRVPNDHACAKANRLEEQLDSATATFVGGMNKAWPATLHVSPGAISTCDPASRMRSRVSWHVDASPHTHIKVMVADPGSSQYKLFASGGTQGSIVTGDWVMPGTSFTLIDARTGVQLASYNIVAAGCSSRQ